MLFRTYAGWSTKFGDIDLDAAPKPVSLDAIMLGGVLGRVVSSLGARLVMISCHPATSTSRGSALVVVA